MEKIMDTQQLARLNSMTKYPSILTYHQLGDRGKLEDHVQIPFDDDEDVFVTEKVDGTNTRIIYLPDGDYIIGSREELLHAKGDRIWVPTEGIIDTLKEHDIVSRVQETIKDVTLAHMPLSPVWVVFGEVFGGKTGQSKQYTGKKGTGFRIFDVFEAQRSLVDDMVFGQDWDCQKISAWRQSGGQTFVTHERFTYWFAGTSVQLTPRLGAFKGKDIPKKHKDMLEWLQRFAKTQCRLDDGANAKSEGVVIRNENRSKIAKIRFEDYERTLRKAK
jgi:hypothetical protein